MLLVSHFTTPVPLVPQNQTTLYAYNIGDTVTIDATPTQRRSLGFKYTLNLGLKKYIFIKQY